VKIYKKDRRDLLPVYQKKTSNFYSCFRLRYEISCLSITHKWYLSIKSYFESTCMLKFRSDSCLSKQNKSASKFKINIGLGHENAWRIWSSLKWTYEMMILYIHKIQNQCIGFFLKPIMKRWQVLHMHNFVILINHVSLRKDLGYNFKNMEKNAHVRLSFCTVFVSLRYSFYWK
jgi:hypothetical protein